MNCGKDFSHLNINQAVTAEGSAVRRQSVCASSVSELVLEGLLDCKGHVLEVTGCPEALNVGDRAAGRYVAPAFCILRQFSGCKQIASTISSHLCA